MRLERMVHEAALRCCEIQSTLELIGYRQEEAYVRALLCAIQEMRLELRARDYVHLH
jgi:hypothetical protein